MLSMQHPVIFVGILCLITHCSDGLITVARGTGAQVKHAGPFSSMNMKAMENIMKELDDRDTGKEVSYVSMSGEKEATGEVSENSNVTFGADNSNVTGGADEGKTNATTAADTKAKLAAYYKKLDPRLVRPSVGKGPDNVSFGILLMNFYGADLAHHTFSIDMAMTLRWHDPRAAKLLKPGTEKLSMAWTQALKLLWMPGVVVTNREIEKYEITSASVTIFKSGEVLRVERANARCMLKFALAEYPFDTQHLQIKIASSKYMVNEVMLKPDANASAVHENIFGLYGLQSWSATSYMTADGAIKKSRGVLDVKVKRNLDKYFQDHLVPTFIVLTISCTVFYFPFANPFITARLCLSILALLTFTNLMLQSDKELPGSAPFNWNNLFNQIVQALMFLTIITNIMSEIIFHHFHCEDLGRFVNNEAKLIMPFLSVFSISVILAAAHYKQMTIHTTSIVAKAVVGGIFSVYFGYVAFSLYNEVKKQHLAANAAVLAAIASQDEKAGDDGDADCDPGC